MDPSTEPFDAADRPLTESAEPHPTAARWPDPSDLLAQATGTARVLDALAGGAQGPPSRVDTDEAPSQTAPCETPAGDPLDTAAFGPRLSPGLDGCGLESTGLFGGRSHTGQSTRNVDDLSEWLGRTHADLHEDLALADEFRAQLAKLQNELMVGAMGPAQWPDDLIEPAELLARDAEMACVPVLAEEGTSVQLSLDEPPRRAEGLPDAPEPGQRDAEQAAPSPPPAVRDESVRPAASRGEVRQSDRTPSARSSAEDPPQRRTDRRDQPDARTDAAEETSQPVGKIRFGRRRRGQLDPDALREKRQQMIRKALARSRERSASWFTARKRDGATMTEPSHLTWKPGDPFAGWHPMRKTGGFRWHAMLLTAGGIACVGYVALRLIMLTGTIAG